MALNVLGSQFDKLRDVTFHYPDQRTRPFCGRLSGRLICTLKRGELVFIGEELIGGNGSGKNFKRSFQRWRCS
ncbi:hypothetical protein [Klebsiella pneumoniae]|uniref:hypothetical protein n=1 Tax=Klebsiella pneumoniae TaxID=573 RepID=UPI003986D7EE